MKKILLTACGILLLCMAHGQTPNQQIPLSYQFYQKLNKSVYDVNKKYHSAIKAYFSDDSTLLISFDSLMDAGIDSNIKRNWIRRKLTQEHLLNFNGEDYFVYADFLPDLAIGRDFKGAKNTWLNTRGFQIGGSIGDKFSFHTSGFENQGVFASYYSDFIDRNQVVPGQSGGDKLNKSTKDWAYVTALLSYTANKHLNVALGHDKNFIGDGYRSLLLSDIAPNYTFLRLRVTLGNVQYQTIFAQMSDPGAERFTTDRRLGSRLKWAAIHYVDWNVTNRFSLGFFQAITWADAEKEGKRGFDFNYIHPFVFLRPLETSQVNSPDKNRLGLNIKYEILNNTVLYGQFMLDEFRAKDFFSNNGNYRNKYAFQVGLKGSDLLKIPNLNYLAEFNSARPYTYSHFNRVSNYGHYNQPLAHPLGANFREVLGILNYSYKRLDFQAQFLYAQYGLDSLGVNYGKNIFLDYETRVSEYGNVIGQGIKTGLYYGEGKMAFLVNPKYNLRLEVGGIIRQEKNSISNQRSVMITFGLRSSFRNLYADF